MTGTQCDTCRSFAPGTPDGWLILLRVQPSASPFAAALGIGGGSSPEPVGTFCKPACAAEFAYVLAAAESPGIGS